MEKEHQYLAMIIRFPPAGASRINAVDGILSRYSRALSRNVAPKTRRTFSTVTAKHITVAGGISTPRLRSSYFLDNVFLDASKGIVQKGNISTTSIGDQTPLHISSKTSDTPQTSSNYEELPHRRRQRERQDTATPSRPIQSSAVEPVIPPDASSVLTTAAARHPINSLRRTMSTLLALSKPRLSFMIVLTATTAYSLYPVPTLLSPAITDTPSLSALTLLFLTVGTGLSSASANALNMLYEPKWDAMMSRTKNRPLVRGLISKRGALIFAIVSGVVGVGALYYGVNPTVAFLGALNIFIYAGVYTPMKRISVVNTWVGALVGGIPPLMGWAAAAGQSATGSGDWQELLFGERSAGGWLIAALLFAWQFPHFMALSWPIRFEYRDAGYKMLAWTNPARNGRVALRYSLVFIPVCVAMCYVGVTEWSFAFASAPVNLWLIQQSYRFWKHEGLKGSARGLFWASIWHLPVVMVLAMLEKKGMWQRAWKSVVGEPELDGELDDDWIDEEDEEPVRATKPTPVAVPSR